MTVRHVIPELDRAGLRQFGLLTGAIVAALFGVILPWAFARAWPLWPWLVLAALGGFALVLPGALRPVYKAWMKFGMLASRVTTPLLMGIVFFLMISPMGLVKRVFGRDAMARSFEPDASSYRVKSEGRPVKDLERPF